MISAPGPAIGIDLGGTKLAIGGLTSEVGADSDPDGVLVGHRSFPVDTRDYDDTLDRIAAEVLTLAKAQGWSDPDVGMSVAGFLSPDRLELVEALNLGWRNRNLRDDLARRVGLPVTVHNDANAAAWGEYLLAGSPAAGSLIMLTLGTDVGGGVITGGRLLTGAFGIGGELGHLVVEPNGPVCVCGAAGCLAVFASGKAITAGVREVLSETEEVGEISPAELTRLAADGDTRVLTVLDRAARAIAVASAQISRVIDHHTIILGGGAGQLGEPLLTAVRRHLALGVPIGPLLPIPRVRPARAGNRAGVIGAAALGRHRHPAG